MSYWTGTYYSSSNNWDLTNRPTYYYTDSSADYTTNAVPKKETKPIIIFLTAKITLKIEKEEEKEKDG